MIRQKKVIEFSDLRRKKKTVLIFSESFSMFHGVRRPDGTASGMRNRGHHGEEQHEPGLFVSGFDDLSGREGHFSSNQPTYLSCQCLQTLREISQIAKYTGLPQ